MQRHLTIFLTLIVLVGCTGPIAPTISVPGRDAPYPATWTPTVAVERTSTATLVVQPTPTWDGTPPPPSEAEVPRVLPGQLYQALDNQEEVTVVDVRTFAAFNQAHIAGAVHLPLEELGDRVGELDGNQTIVLYDLSLGEALSLEAAMLLYGMGFIKVKVLDGGIQKWYTDGYPIEGTLLTPTPSPAGPPWTVTPLITGTLQPTSVLTPTLTPTSVLTPTVTEE